MKSEVNVFLNADGLESVIECLKIFQMDEKIGSFVIKYEDSFINFYKTDNTENEIKANTIEKEEQHEN